MAENTKEKRTFEVDDKTYAVRRPKVEEIRKGNEIRSKAFNEALQRGDMLREQLESELRKRKLWSDSREEEYQYSMYRYTRKIETEETVVVGQ